jgi:hypothetical protein
MDVSQTQTSDRAKAQHRKWYGENREDYNALRRERYAASKVQREKARHRAARYRSEDNTIGRILTRVINGKTVEVFSTGQVAEILGRTPQMLRNWENADMIPPSTFEDKHRLYTKAQVRMLVSLENIIGMNKGSWSHPKVKAKVRAIAKRW